MGLATIWRGGHRPTLTRRRGNDGREAPQVHVERIRLDEVERVVGLGFDVHPDDVESRGMESGRESATPAAQVEHPRPQRGLTI
jgi:hypothetical protein